MATRAKKGTKGVGNAQSKQADQGLSPLIKGETTRRHSHPSNVHRSLQSLCVGGAFDKLIKF